MHAWSDLDRELDAWDAAGRVATLWWRDDDARGDCPELRRLLEISANCRVPLGLAVIPQDSEESLQPLVAGLATARVLVHGFAHCNHEPAGEKSSELGRGRTAEAVRRELRWSRRRLQALFPQQWFPVLVPPWNRIDERWCQLLPALKIHGLSTFGARQSGLAAPCVAQVNTHVDIVDWRGGRGFVGLERALQQLTEHLALRRSGGADSQEPTGLLTHHQVHDQTCWEFITAVLERTQAHPAAQWLRADEAFESCVPGKSRS